MNEYFYVIFFCASLIWVFWTFFKDFGPEVNWKGKRIRVLLLAGFAFAAGHLIGGVTGSMNQEASAAYRKLFLQKYITVLRESKNIVRGSAEMARVITSPEFRNEVRSITKTVKTTGNVLFYSSMAVLLVLLLLLFPRKRIPLQKQIFLVKLLVIPFFLLLLVGKMVSTYALASTARMNTEGKTAAVILTQEIPAITPEASFESAIHALEQCAAYPGSGEQLLPPSDFVRSLYPAAVLSDGTRAIARFTPQIQIRSTLVPASWSAVIEMPDKNRLKRWIIPLPDPGKGIRYAIKVSGNDFLITDGKHEYRCTQSSSGWNVTGPAEQSKGK